MTRSIQLVAASFDKSRLEKAIGWMRHELAGNNSFM